MTPLCRGEKEFFRKEDPQISKLEAQIAALKSHLKCELISMNSKIETMSEFLHKKFKDSNNQNQNIAMLKENINFLQSELKEKNLFVKTLMETQTTALESISNANQQNHTLSSNKIKHPIQKLAKLEVIMILKFQKLTNLLKIKVTINFQKLKKQKMITIIRMKKVNFKINNFNKMMLGQKYRFGTIINE